MPGRPPVTLLPLAGTPLPLVPPVAQHPAVTLSLLAVAPLPLVPPIAKHPTFHWRENEKRKGKGKQRRSERERSHSRGNPHRILTRGRDALLARDASLQKAATLHFQILTEIRTQTDMIIAPTAAEKARFNERFADYDEWSDTLRSLTYSHELGIDKVDEMRRTDRVARQGQITRDIGGMKDPHLHVIFSAVYESGLARFAPDVLGSPDSLYNQAHEDIAIETFQRVALHHAYRRRDMTSLQNRTLLRRLYRHYIFAAMYDKVVDEARHPGSVAGRSEKTNSYKRRQDDTAEYYNFLKEDGWPVATRKLASAPECCSEDERQDDGTYLVCSLPLRSVKAALFKRSISTRLQASHRARSYFKPRTRIHIPDPPPPKISPRIPQKAPIDWFDPAEYNKLSVRLRALIAENGVALPDLYHWEVDEVSGELHVPDHFKTKGGGDWDEYVDEVLLDYKVPTQEEMDNVDLEDDGENGDGSGSGSGENGDGNEEMDLGDED
ncbi:hypothetical protein C8F01DRAFT_1092607 [Mycena amicta]|nr:hypothetical protein C8F01DRAFT_1092607 [Mycena amicta]